VNLPLKVADWPAPWRERFEERAGIIEFMGNLSRQTAEFRAEQDVRKQAAQESQPKPRSPLDLECKTCLALPQEKCTTKPEENGQYVRILNYFHSARWADLTRTLTETAKLAEHQEIYGDTKL